MNCPKCGTKINENDNICPKCGTIINQKKEKNYRPIIIIILLILIIIIMCLFFIKTKKISDNNDKEKNNISDFSNETTTTTTKKLDHYEYVDIINPNNINNIEIDKNSYTSANNIKFIKAFNGYEDASYNFLFKNESNEPIYNFELIVEYYDKDNLRIDRQSSNMLLVNPNTYFSIPLKTTKIQDNSYSTYKLFIKTSKQKSQVEYLKFDNTNYEIKEKEEFNIKGFEINYINKYSKNLTVTYLVLLYKDNEIVNSYYLFESDIEPNVLKTARDINTLYKNTEFNKYEVYVQSSYSYDPNNY